MTADLLFSLSSSVAMLGWVILAIGVVWNKPNLRDVIAGLVFPVGLSVIYTILIGAFFFRAKGGFDSLAHVQELFTYPWAALAGWMHYLAFDLFIGAMIAREVINCGIPRWFLIILLPLTFMFGPIGYVGFVMTRVAFSKMETSS